MNFDREPPEEWLADFHVHHFLFVMNNHNQRGKQSGNHCNHSNDSCQRNHGHKGH